MQKIIKMIDGYKTHIIAALMALVGLVRVVSGEMSLMELINSQEVMFFLGAGALSSSRSAMKKLEQK